MLASLPDGECKLLATTALKNAALLADTGLLSLICFSAEAAKATAEASLASPTSSTESKAAKATTLQAASIARREFNAEGTADRVLAVM
jgi:hypothetical protein